jgi:hypothetical protein
VNHLLPYEHAIAAKINQAPVPDFMDEVWAGIDLQLDAPMPSPGKPVKKSNLSKEIGRARGLKIFIAALVVIAVIIIVKTRKAKQDIKKNNTAAPAIDNKNEIGSDSVTNFPLKKKENSEKIKKNDKPVNTITDSVSKPADIFFPSPIIYDSVVVAPPVILPKANDSALYKPASSPVSVPTPPGKKGKGVKGIKDTDYKIVPVKKDSI